ncbi:reverse transcriptase domain-containing protein [Tanacetum coccineum]
MTNGREMTPPPGFSTPPQIPNVNTSERSPVTTTVFAAITPENTPFAYRSSNSANPNPMISPAFIRNEDLRTELEYFSEDYDEEREMEPRPGPTREATPSLRPRSPRVLRQRERVLGFKEAPNREGSRAGRNAEGSRPLENEAGENGNRGMNLPPLLAAHLGRNKSGSFADPTGSITPFVRWIKDYPLLDGLKMPSHIGSYNGKGGPDNFLHLFKGASRMKKWLMPIACHMFTYTLKDSSQIWWNSQKAGSILNYEDLKAKFRSYFSQQKKFTKTHLAVHDIKQREGKSTRAFATRYTDDTLQIWGLYEDQCISGFVHGLKTRSLVEHLSTDLPCTYKGLIEKTYTWIEAREVETNRAPNDRRENFKRSKKSSWDNNKGQKGRDWFSPYRGPNHRLLSSLSKTFKQPLRLPENKWSRDRTKYCHFHEDHGHDTNQCRELKHQIEEALKSGRLAHLVKGIKKKKEKMKSRNPRKRPVEGDYSEVGEITFPPLSNMSSADPVIIRAYVSGRQVNKVYLDNGSSCEVIYEHCFLKLKPSIRSRVDSKTPLVGFLGEQSWPLGEVPLEITIGEGPLTVTKTLNFVIVRCRRKDSSEQPIPRANNCHRETATDKNQNKVTRSPKGVRRCFRVDHCAHDWSPENNNNRRRSFQYRAQGKRTQTLGTSKAKEKEPGTGKKQSNSRLNGGAYKGQHFARSQVSDMGIKPSHCEESRWKMEAMRRFHRHKQGMSQRASFATHSLTKAKRDKEKIAFYTREGVFCYKRLPFGLKNEGATYQKLIDKVFNHQLGRNMEVNADDMVIKCDPGEEMLADIKETLERLRVINLKLNPKKCSFGVEEGIFSRHLITKQGIKENPSKPENAWKLFTDGASSSDGSGAGLILVSLEGKEYTYALRFEFETTNNEPEYEALLAGLRIAKEMKEVLVEVVKDKSITQREVADVTKEEGDSWMSPIREYLQLGKLPDDPQKARKLRIKAPLYKIIDEHCIEDHTCRHGPRSVVSKIIRLGYYWPSMHKDAKSLIQKCETCQIHSPILRKPKQEMTSIMSAWPFLQWGIDIVGPLPIAP